MDKQLSTFNPADFISFVEGAGVTDRHIKLHAKITSSADRIVARHCSRRGFHTMRFYRDAFARGLRDALQDAAENEREAFAACEGGAAGHAPQAATATLTDRWREIEGRLGPPHAEASDDTSKFGF